MASYVPAQRATGRNQWSGKSRRHRAVRAYISGLLVVFLPVAVVAQAEKKTSAQATQIVLLGTGTPSPDPERSGPATAVVVNGTPYLIDFGPGVVRRIAAASQQGVKGLTVVDVRVAFLTHLHSDHTIGYADLILTPWSVGRSQTDHILEAYREDIAIRRRDKPTQS